MKRTPQEDRIVANMQPGVLCRDGFLGSDARPPAEIIAADDAAVEAMGLTHERLAAALGEVVRAAMATYGTPTDVGEGLRAVYREAMGRIPCPWGHGRTFPKGEIELTHTATGRRILFTPLSVHLIAEHGFYQGRGSRYRIEPDDVRRILSVAAE